MHEFAWKMLFMMGEICRKIASRFELESEVVLCFHARSLTFEINAILLTDFVRVNLINGVIK